MAMKLFENPRLRRCEASTYLEQKHGLTVAVATLAKYARVGGDPTFNLFGRYPLYEPGALEMWATQKLGRARDEHERCRLRMRHEMLDAPSLGCANARDGLLHVVQSNAEIEIGTGSRTFCATTAPQ